MSAAERRYILDTNLFIRAFRDAAAGLALEDFHRVFAPFEYLCAVVVQELRAGARTPADRRRLEHHVLAPLGDDGAVHHVRVVMGGAGG